ncbi:hypothetical protein FHS24_000285 [Psychrobacter luti]|uniref:Uncharacterized protein n=1 Tax=Psychrobacter luti TaxID=198481 RepID=A0A839TCH1_9GAMM|nr:hypothetical protein [Psychrobacter luti]MBB3105794.1 hypothetical protein [Psychrobacter luti]
MMINSKVAATTAAHKNLKKADPIATFKNSILIISVVGTMAGWLILLDQEADSLPVSTAIPVSTSSPNPNVIAAQTPSSVDITQLRQVNEVESPAVEAIAVVARTRSSR